MLAVFALLASLIASVSATLTNITVTDNSPTIKYTPSRSGDSALTWNVSYTGNNWATTSPGNLSQGTSQHLTYYIGATATFGFRGTGIYINGSATGNDAEVAVGGEVITPRGLPASKDGMKDQWWDVVVKVNGNRGVWLYGITFTVDIGNDGASLSTRTIPALNEQNGLNPDLSFSGQNEWGVRTAVGNLTYNRIDTNVGAARVVLPAITGETLIIGYGSVNFDHGRFTVDSSGPVAGWPGSFENIGTSPYMSLDQIIFFGMADWGVMSVTNGDDGSWLDISSITYTTASGGTPSSGSIGGGETSIGIIVGATVGGVVFVAILGVLIWFCLKKRRKASDSYHTPNLVDDTRYDIDPYTETTVASPHHEGYFDSPEMAYANAAGVPATGQYGSKSALSRQSLASPGLTPYQPHSPGMSEGSSHHPSSIVDQSSSQSGSNRYSKTPRQLPVPGNQVRQETDAGRVAVVPPSYNPAWAQDGPGEDITVDSDQTSPAPNPQPPTDEVNVKR